MPTHPLQSGPDPEGGAAPALSAQLEQTTADLKAAEAARAELQKALEEQKEMHELELEAERQRASAALGAQEADVEQRRAGEQQVSGWPGLCLSLVSA